MKQFFEYLGIGAIIVFSFFYTEKAALIVQSKNPIMQEIVEIEDDLRVESVNAVINGDFIIPGSNGLEVDINTSFRNMKSFGAFNEYYLVYVQTKPDISLEKNKEKIIKGANKNKNAISLIFESVNELSLYALQRGFRVNILIEKDTYEINNSYELINNEVDKTKFSDIESLLNKDKINKHICLIQDKNIELCKKYGNYLVQETLTLTSVNLAEIKQKLDKGDIILIKNGVKIDDLKIILNQITYKDLSVMALSDLISEEKN